MTDNEYLVSQVLANPGIVATTYFGAMLDGKDKRIAELERSLISKNALDSQRLRDARAAARREYKRRVEVEAELADWKGLFQHPDPPRIPIPEELKRDRMTAGYNPYQVTRFAS